MDYVSFAVAILGVVLAIVSLIYGVRLGQRSNRIGNESARLASEQEALRRAVKFGAVHRLISIYQLLDDFSSYHMTGTQFLFADGSVKWIGQEINVNLYHALATRAGGEVVGSDD